MFTLRMEPQVIAIHDPGKKVVQENCERCHEGLIENVSLTDGRPDNIRHGQNRLCWDCHREVPHGRVRSLSSITFAWIPVLDSPLPEWHRKKLKGIDNKD
jgi:cytochrome c nitrite reductase small subunit